MNIQNMLNVMAVSNHGQFTACNRTYLIGITPLGRSLEIAPVFMSDDINLNNELYDFHIVIDCDGVIKLFQWDEDNEFYVFYRKLNETDHPSNFVAVIRDNWGAEYFPVEAEEMKQYILDLATEWKRIQKETMLTYWHDRGGWIRLR